MNEREALKLALEALEEIHVGNMTPMAEINWTKAITAIKEALAQPSGSVEQRSDSEHLEPVAWMEGESVYWHTNQSLNDWIRANGTPLYTTPPQRKPLSDEEIEDEWERITGHSIFGGDRSEGRPMFVSPDEVIEFARAIKFNGEAK